MKGYNNMQCGKCKKDVYILELSYNKEYGWICKSCAEETHTALNLFIKKNQEHKNEGEK